MRVTSSLLCSVSVYEYFHITCSRKCSNVLFLKIIPGFHFSQLDNSNRLVKMSSSILHTYPYQVKGNNSFVDFRTAKILIVAKYTGKEITVDEICHAEDGKLAPEFLKKCPLGKIPSLQLGIGNKTQIIGESNAAAYFLSNDQLRGGGSENAIERAQVLQWMNFAEIDLIPLIYNWVFPILGLLKKDENEEAALEKLLELLTKLDNHLGWFGGCPLLYAS